MDQPRIGRNVSHLFDVSHTNLLASVANCEFRRPGQQLSDRARQPAGCGEHQLHEVALRQR